VIYGFVDYWPGMVSPSAGEEGISYFIVANLAQIQAKWGIQPYEIWMKNLNGSSQYIYDFAERHGLAFETFIATGDAKAGDYHTFAGRLLNYANSVSKTDAAAAVAIYDKAAAAATTGVERSNSPYAQERKAIILFSKNSGVAEEVAVAFEKVVELLDADEQYKSDADTYKTALSVIGDYYSSIGDKAKALAAYTRYTQFDPNNEKVNNKISALSAE